MAGSGGEVWISLFALEELFECRATALGEPEEALWGLLPDALVERVLLFLPKSDQARLRLVCKRWRQLMTSPAFLEETTALSFRHGYPICALPSTSVTCSCSCDHMRRLEERCKVRRVDFPGFMPPPQLLYKGKAFTKFGLPIIGLHYDDYQSREIRCWLLNLADQSWRQLPPLRGCGFAPSNSVFWLVQKEECTNFQVFAMRGTVHYTYFHTFSPGTSTDWQSFKIEDPVHAEFGVNQSTGWALISGGRDFLATEGHWRFKPELDCFSTSWPDRELKHMMITTPGPDDDDQYRDYYDEPTYDNIGVLTPDPLPDVPREYFKLLTDSDSDDVFAYSTEYGDDEDKEEGSGVCLYKLDRARGQWECLLFEQLPPGLPGRLFDEDGRGQIVGSMVLIQFEMGTLEDTVATRKTLWIMAYNMLDGSCKWSRTLSGLGYDAATADRDWYPDTRTECCFPRRFTTLMMSFLAPL